MRPNLVRQALREGRSVAGPFVGVASATMAELFGAAGCDFIVIDTEHSAMGMIEAEHLIRGADVWNMTSIVRVYTHHFAVINKALDAGAQGVFMPQVNTAAQAEQIVRAARYAPRGIRGVAGITRAAGYGTADLRRHVAESNEEILVIIQIETVEAMRNLDGILQVEGIDLIFIGPNDLSLSLGFPGQRDHASVQEAIETIAAKVQEANMPLGITASTPEAALDYAGKGYQFLMFDSISLVVRGARAYMNRFHGRG